MSRLLKSDFYKVFKSKSFYVCGIIVAALAVMVVFVLNFSYDAVSAQAVAGNTVINTFPILFNSSNNILFTAIVVSIFVASEFGFGTIKNVASRGFSRTNIYLSKLIVSVIISTIFMAVYILTLMISGSCVWKFGDTSGSVIPDLLRMIGLEFLLNVAFTSLFVTIASLVRQTGGAIAINICVMEFVAVFAHLLSLLYHRIFNQTIEFSNYLLSANCTAVASYTISNEVITRSVIVGFVYLIVTIAIGIWLFNKRDIK